MGKSNLRRHGLLYMQRHLEGNIRSWSIFISAGQRPCRKLATCRAGAIALLAEGPEGLSALQSPSVSWSPVGNRSFGVREEYRVSRKLLEAIDRAIRADGCPSADVRVADDNSPNAPFFVYRTSTFLPFVRRNINRLCLGFEMARSLHPHTEIVWQHSWAMMMFLRALMDPSIGVWHDLQLEESIRPRV